MKLAFVHVISAAVLVAAITADVTAQQLVGLPESSLAAQTVAGASDPQSQLPPPAQTTPTPPSKQIQPPGTRRTIGVALGGGAARGIAHIGLLRWFEEHRIPIDFVGGTSMGGLVGGAYAGGMSPDALQQLMKMADWDIVFLNDAPFKYKNIRRKEDSRSYPALIRFGLKGWRLRIPAALNAGQQVDVLLDTIAAPYYKIQSFDELPIPFRAVATDLKTAESVVLSQGSLAGAMRATMSIPGVFAPVAIGDRLFIDGGTLDNVPAGVVRNMGADVVIAIDVGARPGELKTSESLFSYLGRTLDTMMSAAVRRSLQSADVVIVPDLEDLSGGDWRDSDEFVRLGYAAAEKNADKLLPYAVDEAAWNAYLEARNRKRLAEIPVPATVRVSGIDNKYEEGLILKAAEPLVGKPIDLSELNVLTLRLMGTDRYETVGFNFEETADGQVALLIRARLKDYAPPFLRLAFDLNNTDSTSFSGVFRGRLLTMDTFGAGSEIRADFALGSRQTAAIELYKPFGRSHIFVSGRGYYDRYINNSYVDDVLVAEYRTKRTGAGADVGVSTSFNSELRLGYDIADVSSNLRVGEPTLPEATGSERLASLRWVYDGQTSPLVPTRGLYLRTSLRYFWETPEIVSPDTGDILTARDLVQGELNASIFKTISPRGRIFARGGAGTSFNDEAGFERFRLGGVLNIGSKNLDELSGNHFLVVAGGYLHTLSRLPDFIGGNIYAGSWLETGAAYDHWDETEWRNALSGGILVESLLGPLFFGGSVGLGGGGGRFYVALGPLFK